MDFQTPLFLYHLSLSYSIKFVSIKSKRCIQIIWWFSLHSYGSFDHKKFWKILNVLLSAQYAREGGLVGWILHLPQKQFLVATGKIYCVFSCEKKTKFYSVFNLSNYTVKYPVRISLVLGRSGNQKKVPFYKNYRACYFPDNLSRKQYPNSQIFISYERVMHFSLRFNKTKTFAQIAAQKW